MATTSLGTVTVAGPTGSPVAWAGGDGTFHLEGTTRTIGAGVPGDGQPGDRPVFILETDLNGEYKPAGDVILRTENENVGFFLPPCNVRIRCVGGDSTTSVEGFVADLT